MSALPGAAVAQPLTETLRKVYHLEGYEMSPLASAYARARGAGKDEVPLAISWPFLMCVT